MVHNVFIGSTKPHTEAEMGLILLPRPQTREGGVKKTWKKYEYLPSVTLTAKHLKERNTFDIQNGMKRVKTGHQYQS